MLTQEENIEIQTASGPMGLLVISPKLPAYPKAKWPGVVCFSEIYQVTAPVARFARSIASSGYIVVCPAVFHEMGPEGSQPYAYDNAGTDKGNAHKNHKLLKHFDDDAKCAVDFLQQHPNCTGRIGATGMCLGGALAFRCAYDPRILATTCYFPTDLHTETLGAPGPSDCLERAKEIQGEIQLIFGLSDTHVDEAGRTKIRARMNEVQATTWFLEVPAAHAFIRDEASKGRYDASLTRACFDMQMDLFERALARDLGPMDLSKVEQPKHVC